MKQHASLGELAINLGINKSKLAYYFSLGLLKPVSSIGRMNIFDSAETMKTIKKIDTLKKAGQKLESIKDKI